MQNFKFKTYLTFLRFKDNTIIQFILQKSAMILINNYNVTIMHLNIIFNRYRIPILVKTESQTNKRCFVVVNNFLYVKFYCQLVMTIVLIEQSLFLV